MEETVNKIRWPKHWLVYSVHHP